jgi:CBS domain containing-hemolysin-like protein|tara:strand:- start:11296 stop:12132 length:837 start_codon:yes stop_codon:yes gene_type:complete
MLKIFNKFKNLLKFSDKENIKEVLEDLIEDDVNGSRNIDDGTRNIFKNVINLSDKCIEDIMIPRADIDAVSIDITYNELLIFIDKTKHSRIPVFDGNLDKVQGMIHIRDLFEKTHKNSSQQKKLKISKKIVRKILFSSPTMKILDLLLKMRSEQIHMSIIVDEFGGTNGLVTIEDLVEEIVGEIKDEHDFEEIEEIKKVSKKNYEVSARTSIDEFEEKLGIKLKIDKNQEIDTLGGFIFFYLGRIPGRGEVINYDKLLEFTILEADTRKIKRILVSLK